MSRYAQYGCNMAGAIGSLMNCPPTNWPRDNSTRTIHPPNEPSAVTIYYCDVLQVFFVHIGSEVDGLSHVTLCPLSSKCFVTHVTLSWKFGWLSHMISEPICDVLLAIYWLWMFCQHVCNVSVKCVRFGAWFWAPFVMSCRLLSECGCFVTRFFLYVGVRACVCVRESTNPWISVPCAMWKWAKMAEFFEKTDPL